MMISGYTKRTVSGAAGILFLLTVTVVPLAAQQNDPRAAAIVRRFEAKLNVEGLDITNTFNLVQKKPGEADRVLQIRVYRRDRNNLFTLIFQYPPSEKGKGYYRDGDNLYLYLPATREFVYRSRRDDVGSTDVRTDTFGRLELEKQYALSYAGTAKVASWECDVIALKALSLDVSFPVQRWFVRQSDGLPVKVENYSASETLLRTVYYIQYQTVNGERMLFTKLLSIDNLQPGQKTYITIDAVSSEPIPDYVFSKAFLEQQSR